MKRRLTKPGKHGTLTLYRIAFRTGDPGDPFTTAQFWAYDAMHAADRFWESFYSDSDASEATITNVTAVTKTT